MNEFNAQIGGRYVYVDDVLNLQDLALAFGRIFDECDSFIISGCEVSDTAISSGYVYLNGKIRYFSGANSITTWPQYLYEKNYTESVHYANGNTKIGRNIYSVSISSTMPTTTDSVTGKVPVSMTITQSGGTLMKDAFFGKYALVLNPANLAQTLNGSLKIDGSLDITGKINASQSRYSITESQATFDAFFNNGVMTLQTEYSTGDSYAIAMEDGTGILAYVNGSLTATIEDGGISIPGYIKASLGILGNVGVSNAGIYNRTDATDSGSININIVGYNGENQYFRNTVIGNGKGSAIVSVDGKAQTVNIAGVTTIASGNSTEGVVLLLNKTKSSADIQKSIVWKDSSSETIGALGFTESTGASFRLTNNLSGVYVYGASNSFVDIGPVIKENGQLLTDKYVQITNFNNTVETLAKSEDVYNKTQSDARYSQVADGFNGYISAGNTQDVLRKQIGAVSSTDLSNYVSKHACLADIATTEDIKKQIRTNIGAAGVGDYQAKLQDSGWIKILTSGLYIRQIGNIVSIQGNLKTIHSGTIFTIPNTIDPPTHAVYQSFSFANNLNWTVGIVANSRSCRVLYCNGSCGNSTIFSLTYMV